MKNECRKKYGNRKRFFGSIARAFKKAFKIGSSIIQWPFIKGDLAKCNHGAEIYFDSVDSFGGSSYVKRSPSWCEQRCAKEAGDPKM